MFDTYDIRSLKIEKDIIFWQDSYFNSEVMIKKNINEKLI